VAGINTLANLFSILYGTPVKQNDDFYRNVKWFFGL